MSDVLMIVPSDLADGFRLAGARAWPAESPGEAQALLVAALDDPRAGIVGIADVYYEALALEARRAMERRYRPVVIPVPTTAGISAEDQRRAAVQELIRRAIGLRVVLGHGAPGPG